jgi:ABC-type phosphate/phosphonate transport system permease subunit
MVPSPRLRHLAVVIAIALSPIGFMGKILFDAIEEIDSGQIRAIRAPGAGPWMRTALIRGYGVGSTPRALY